VAQRYCTNCGAEPREDASFCGKCGRPVHETARVSTPEADVPVPPPPVQDGRTAAAGIPQDQDMETTEWWQTPIGKSIVKAIGVLVAIIVVPTILVILGGGVVVDVVLALLGAVINVVGLAIIAYIVLVFIGVIPSTAPAKVGHFLFSRLRACANRRVAYVSRGSQKAVQSP
jgi:zinc-ribbon domain